MNMEEWEVELKKQKEEVEEEVCPILKKQGQYQQYLEELIQALQRAKGKYCKRHGITIDEYDYKK